ncbi:hypothetical protein [Dictyobacter formicarum]|uniref:Uncharacterized protein n=1 Tax=Dictyobacter formicarum TaxID=2778368 RepID=A0ABQ3VLQ7_9CHLR|nr:hypothetical protein [Dictyobacter formicarum]GHO87147.1 hypothetical protein KSZ_51530 [Dictyobacter formicarum]
MRLRCMPAVDQQRRRTSMAMTPLLPGCVTGPDARLTVPIATKLQTRRREEGSLIFHTQRMFCLETLDPAFTTGSLWTQDFVSF